MTKPETAAAAILADMMTRKGFPAFFDTIEPQTQERAVEAWAKIIDDIFSKEER